MKVPKEFALLPLILLDYISTDWVLGPGNNLLTHYKDYALRRQLVYLYLRNPGGQG